MDFAQQCAVVTGGESGIGRACAQMLGRSGAAVVLTYFRDEAAAAEVVRDIAAAGGKAITHQADVGDEAAVEALFAAAEAAFGPVRLLAIRPGSTSPSPHRAWTTGSTSCSIIRSKTACCAAPALGNTAPPEPPRKQAVRRGRIRIFRSCAK